MNNVQLINNSSSGNGGAIASIGGTANIANSKFDGNSAGGSGGGMYADSSLSVGRSLFIQNQAVHSGGALFGSISIQNAISLTDTTITLNLAADGGGLNFWRDSQSTPPQLHNLSMVGNSASLGGEMISSGRISEDFIFCVVIFIQSRLSSQAAKSIPIILSYS